MVIRPRPGLLQVFFILRGSVVKRIYPQILLTAALAALVVWAGQTWPESLPLFDGGPFALLGIALSIFLGFRNSACYDRWWEARRQWGALVAATRALERQTLILPEGEPGGRPHLLRLAIAFAQAMVGHLRGGGEDKTEPWLTRAQASALAVARNRPAQIAMMMGEELTRLRAERLVAGIPFQMLDHTIGEMVAIEVACERIHNTPIPFGYTLLVHRTAYLFCFLLPFGLARPLGWATPLATALVAYTFFGLDSLGDELEEPFGRQENALPIGALADTIELNLREALGETDLPPPPAPKDYLLM